MLRKRAADSRVVAADSPAVRCRHARHTYEDVGLRGVGVWRRDDSPRALGQALQNLAGPRDFIDAIGRHRLTRFQKRRLRLDAELGSDQSNSFSCGPAVCERDHGVGIERMARCPSTPRALDAFRGIDEDAIQVEQDCFAAKGSRDCHDPNF